MLRSMVFTAAVLVVPAVAHAECRVRVAAGVMNGVATSTLSITGGTACTIQKHNYLRGPIGHRSVPSAGLKITGRPAHGTVTVAGSRITYKPGPGYHGTDSFTFSNRVSEKATFQHRVAVTIH